MRLRTGSPGAEIVGMGHFQPERSVSNDDLAAVMDTSDEWIRRRTGILTRHLASEAETVASMATAAARHALETAACDPRDIDLVIVATTTAEERSPNTAGRVAAGLDLAGPAVLDINTACSGFEYALGLADQSIRSGSASAALVIGSEKLSAFTDRNDRSTAVLTADGAGAAIVRASDEARIGPVVWGSEPSLVDAVVIGPPSNTFRQSGRDVFRWAIGKAAGHGQRAIAAAGMTTDDIAVLACHQANLRIIEPVAEALGLSTKIVVTDVTESGNTSAASVPLGLSKWWHLGKIPPDVPALLLGFGGGFTFAGQVVMTPRKSSQGETVC
ncbi:beta-ketoacyl-ACP synthase 3 [Nakamurella lactea]|uniref:beta-ketoacyl-ACP synthase 3 n=1 Tax=Nakamurella lactea TaxID=459515 RepID=UPI0004142D8D